MEVTLVIFVILSMTLVLFIGVGAYKKGSNRALCIQNIASVQTAIRSYSNLYARSPGETVADLKNKIIGPGKFMEWEPVCLSGGIYTYAGDAIPPSSVAYLSCSVPEHVPKTVSGW